MTPEEAKALREPFPPETIGKLPRIWCQRCSKSDSRVCQEHQKATCKECGNKMTTAHLHLDYVGHAATTDRLLQVDPGWTWRPMVSDPETMEPKLSNGGLWIYLTVCGVTRPGWGDGKNMKEMIGDAIRNAAMRFGVALDLWAKEDLPGADEGPTDRQVMAQTIAEATNGKAVPPIGPSRTKDVELPPLIDAQAQVADNLPITETIDPADIDFTTADVLGWNRPTVAKYARKFKLEGSFEDWQNQLAEMANP